MRLPRLIATPPAGFTLIELMIAVSMIGILSAVATPKIQSVLYKSQEAMTLGNLAALRASINAYMAGTEGRYPTDNLNSLITEGYISAIPMAKTPPNGDGTFTGHTGGNTLGAGPRSAWGGSTEKWYYFNDPNEPEWFGKIIVNCGHKNSRGVPWDEN